MQLEFGRSNSNYDQGCGITMPDSYIEPAGQVDFPD